MSKVYVALSIQAISTLGDSDGMDFETFLNWVHDNCFTVKVTHDVVSGIYNMTYTLHNRKVVSFSQGSFSSLPRIGTGSLEVALWQVAFNGDIGDIESISHCRVSDMLEVLMGHADD